MTVDGTDFLIEEPQPFDEKWFSHKFKHAGLRYEIAVNIKTGWIVWVNGPFAAGSYDDLTIFRSALLQELMPGERVETDQGYRGEIACSRPSDYVTDEEKWMKSKAMARHENINGRLKRFNILTHRYRGDRNRHGDFVRAIAAIVQFDIRSGFGVYQVHYNIMRVNHADE